MFSSNTSAVSGDANYIEDVFSTHLFTGTGSATAINNGIDLSTKGGLVWIKDRDSGAMGHALFDTARGGAYKLQSQSTNGQSSYNNIVFGTTGFTNDTQSDNNNSGTLYTSWTFRKQPKFFDVVAFTSTETTNQRVAHSLGSVPGCIIIKRTSAAGSWFVYHQTQGRSKYLALQSTTSAQTQTNFWGTSDPTSTDFGIDTSSVAAAGDSLVAYVFAHNAGGFGLAGTDNVITCGSYTGTGAAGNAINLGFEPQFVLIKNSTAGSYPNWFTFDNMRGMAVGNGDPYLYANSANAEAGGSAQYLDPTATGFNMMASNVINESGQTYIYIAIRRGPMKVPTDATKLFAVSTRSSTAPAWTSNFPVDWFFQRTTGADNWAVLSRLTGTDQLRFNTTDAATTATEFKFDWMNGVNGSLYNDSTDHGWMMRRAPSFFDEVCYTGNGATTGRTINHNLGVVPELIIVKDRSAGNQGWAVYDAFNGPTKMMMLAYQNASQTYSAPWYNTAPTSSVFTVNYDSGALLRQTNQSGVTFVAYLFATCPGVSKVGSYTGTGTTKQVDCGFAAGARFVLIKRTDSSGDWYVWDTARGIVSGNDPYLLMNSTAAEVTSTDYIDTYSAGFELSSTAPAALNASGGTYIFLAIA